MTPAATEMWWLHVLSLDEEVLLLEFPSQKKPSNTPPRREVETQSKGQRLIANLWPSKGPC